MIKRFLEVVGFLLFFNVFVLAGILVVVFSIVGVCVYIVTGNKYYIDVDFLASPLEKTEDLQNYLSKKLFS